MVLVMIKRQKKCKRIIKVKKIMIKFKRIQYNRRNNNNYNNKKYQMIVKTFRRNKRTV